MIVAVVKKYLNGRWVDFDVSELYHTGQIVTDKNANHYKVTSINGSKVILEKVSDILNSEGDNQ